MQIGPFFFARERSKGIIAKARFPRKTRVRLSRHNLHIRAAQGPSTVGSVAHGGMHDGPACSLGRRTRDIIPSSSPNKVAIYPMGLLLRKASCVIAKVSNRKLAW